MRTLQGGCQVPIGAISHLADQTLHLRGVVLDVRGQRRIEGEVAGPIDQAERLGEELARNLVARGAAELLRDR